MSLSIYNLKHYFLSDCQMGIFKKIFKKVEVPVEEPSRTTREIKHCFKTDNLT